MQSNNSQNQLSPTCHMLAASEAGILTLIITNPQDAKVRFLQRPRRHAWIVETSQALIILDCNVSGHHSHHCNAYSPPWVDLVAPSRWMRSKRTCTRNGYKMTITRMIMINAENTQQQPSSCFCCCYCCCCSR